MKIKKIMQEHVDNRNIKFTLDESIFTDYEDIPIKKGDKEKVDMDEDNLLKDTDDVFALLNSLDDNNTITTEEPDGVLKPIINPNVASSVIDSNPPETVIAYDDDFSPGEGELSTPITDDKALQNDKFHPELNSKLTDPVLSDPQPPKTQEDNGIAELIMGAIKDEYDAISYYNSITLALKDFGKDEYLKIISDITNEEMLHVGQLQELLKNVSPNAESIKEGETEAQEQLVDNNAPVIVKSTQPDVNAVSEVATIDIEDVDDSI